MELHKYRRGYGPRQQKQDKHRRGAVRFLACLIALCTIQVQIVPAVAPEVAVSGGLPETVYKEDRSAGTLPAENETADPEASSHTDACHETARTLICGLDESDEHTHTEVCYSEAPDLLCDQTETAGIAEQYAAPDDRSTESDAMAADPAHLKAQEPPQGKPDEGEDGGSGSAYSDAPDTAVLDRVQQSAAPEATRALAFARAPNYDVWFDGTLGMSDKAINCYPGATNTHATAVNSQVTLPVTAGNPAGYVLAGWYDIADGVYYQRGQTVTVSKNTVFYADWVPENDNYRDTGRALADTVDTGSFIKTELFDYNELINAMSGAPSITFREDSSGHVTGHSETWQFDATISDGFDFAFTQWAYYNIQGGYGRIGALSGLNDRNRYHSNNPSQIVPGIVEHESDAILQTLFTDSAVPGVRKVGEGNHLYQFDSATGYYYYDSDKNGVSYQADDNRFYVYNDVSYIRGQMLFGNNWYNQNSTSSAFMPLDSERYINEQDGTGNFWFGMKNTIDFFLPEKPGTNNGNCNYSTTGRPMEFKFSGDDDVWVFIDGELVLDLGGIHSMAEGTIDFSKGTVTQNGVTTPLPDSIREGEHTLTMYYLERGSSKSNCSIYFSIAPRYALELTKKDPDTQQLLSGAEFTLYTDPGCTIPAMLWGSKADFDSGAPACSTFTAVDGRLDCWGLAAGKTYYIKETRAPGGGYADLSGAVIALTLDSRGDPSAQVTDPSGLLGVVDIHRDSTIQRIRMTVTNQKPQTTQIRAEKVWLDADGAVTTEGEPIQLQLYRSTQQMQSSGTYNVYVTTQYFSADGIGGANSDDAPIIPGDYSRVIPVAGGSDLHVALQSLAPRAGFYSVTANGRAISPEDPVYGTENCCIGGSWGRYPIQSAGYTLTDVSADQHVVLTLIGYPNWENGTVSIADNIQVGVTETPHGSGGQPEVPSVKPEDAVPVGAPVTVMGDANGIWSHVWTNLALGDGSSDYYYYVEETALDGYVTTYSGNGTQRGTVTVTNRAAPNGICLTIRKLAEDSSAAPLSGAQFDLYRPAAEGESGVALAGLDGLFMKVNDAPITTGQDGRAVWEGLEEGVYYLVETAAPTGYLLNSTPHRIVLTNTSAGTEAGDTSITGSPSAPMVTLTNTPKGILGDLVVEKNWFKQVDDSGTTVEDTPPTDGITFQLHRKYQAETVPETCNVTIMTQYYSRNRDTEPPNPGNLSRVIQVSGGSDLRLVLRTNRSRAGIHSVSINGQTAANEHPAPQACTQSCLIGGSEGVYPPRDGIYTLTDITTDQTVVITLIGSLAREGGVSSVAATLLLQEEEIPHEATGGGGGVVEEIVSLDGTDTFTLSSENDWHMGFHRTDLYEQPGVEYTYWVVETPVPEDCDVSYRSEQSGDGRQLYLIIDNTRRFHAYTLPKTGGPGVLWPVWSGAVLSAGALTLYGYTMTRRRSGRR